MPEKQNMNGPRLKRDKRKASKKQDTIDVLDSVTSDVIQTTYEQPVSDIDFDIPLEEDLTVSTGSTLLDLIISGGRIRGGGIPAGIICEFFGASGCGKTAVLSEIAASAQVRGGQVLFLDPEARLDKNYAKTFGLTIDIDSYARPDTVSEMFNILEDWEPENLDIVNIVASDSLAALSTDLEMESSDKMGMRRAKEFSEGLRKTCRLIKKKKYIIACSNQIRSGTMGGTKTPGGNAIPFYASLRVSMKRKSKVEISKQLPSGQRETRVIGVETLCEVIKSSIDVPFRSCLIYIIFNHGVDDVRGNLQWLKKVTGDKQYDVFDRKYQSMADAVRYIEQHDYEDRLRQTVIDLWLEIENEFKVDRKPKKRF